MAKIKLLQAYGSHRQGTTLDVDASVGKLLCEAKIAKWVGKPPKALNTMITTTSKSDPEQRRKLMEQANVKPESPDND